MSSTPGAPLPASGATGASGTSGLTWAAGATGVPGSRPAGEPGVPLGSAVTGVEATRGTVQIGGRAWQRTSGTLHGVVDPREQVAGLAELPRDEQGRIGYRAEFEVLAPEEGCDLVLVDVENRGRPAMLLALEQLALGSDVSTPTGAVYPAGRGIGFLGEQGLGYARVQWEAGIAAGVPATAQGVGEVLVRDFGRLLTGAPDVGGGGSGSGGPDGGGPDSDGSDGDGSDGGGRAPADAGLGAVPRFGTALLAGISQSAWFVTTFVAEGFNVDPRTGRGVYAAALAVSGTGNWLALNQLAGEEVQRPYLLEHGVPLQPGQVLTRPDSDPLYVDVATYTDYYRLRAGVTAHGERSSLALRYDWPAPHAGPAYPDAIVFGALGCNGGVEVPRNPIAYDPYLRSLVADVVELLRCGDAPTGSAAADASAPGLPRSTVFDLLPPPAGATVNQLPGVELLVPAADPDTAQPLGGVRFPDAVVPLGRPLPVALGPLRTSSITDVCGNWGGWQPFDADELRARYGDVEGYLARYSAAVDDQIEAGHLRPDERERMLTRARRSFVATGA